MRAFTTIAIALLALATAGAQTLSPEVKKGIYEGLDDEWRVQAFYTTVMLKFGEQRPFSNIVRAEGMHASILEGLTTKYALEKPKNPYVRNARETNAAWISRMEVPATIREAYRVSYDGEVLNVAIYDRLLKLEMPKDVRDAFTKLRNDSRDRHMRAFYRMLYRGSAFHMMLDRSSFGQ